jgi:large subunit ribosomal protein L10
MDNPRPEKVAVVEEVRSRLDQADAVIVTEYRGLKVKDLAALRRSLVPLGGEYRVFKNTLVRIAATEVGAEDFADLLTGPTALAFVRGDAAAVTRTLRDFARANPLLHIKGGLLGRSVLGPDATLALADLPSREQLLARLAGGLAAPMQNLAGLLAALPRNFAYGLAALRDKRAAGEPVVEQPVAAAHEPAPPAAAAEAEEPPAPVVVAEEPAANEAVAEEPAATEEEATTEEA